jgi:serine/threonine protein kinase
MIKEPIVIGEGAYGCVIKPSLSCANKNITYKNKISKVMLSKEAVKELKEYNIISKADKTSKFYLGIPTHCRIKKTRQAIKAIEKCSHMKKKYLHKKSVKDNIGKFDLLVMKDGGVNLKMLANMVDEMSNTHENQMKVKKIWFEMHKLFLGILLFQKHGIVHHDVKPQNIVYNMNENRTNFIDFGHMRNVSREIRNSNRSGSWIYNYPFWNYPFEIQFLNKIDYMSFAHKSIDEKELVFSDLLADLDSNSETKFVDAFNIFMEYIIHNRSHHEEKDIINRYLQEFHTMLINQTRPENYNAFINKSIRTIDVYGLGMSLYYLLNCSARFLKDQVVDSMELCFFNMTTPNLLQRFTIEEAIDMYESILIESGFMTEFGMSFQQHEIVKNIKSTRMQKKISRISSKYHGSRTMTATRLQNALTYGTQTKKYAKSNSHNTTRRVY